MPHSFTTYANVPDTLTLSGADVTRLSAGANYIDVGAAYVNAWGAAVAPR